ncbi:MAG: glycogen synthase GlgA [Gammaproteobacteria bacterium]|nr:glycogen synthase GlgA [Gammaproteobacteria bacterium]
MSVNKILFVTSEIHPLIKTGGLADVSASLPKAIKALRRDIRMLLPAYRSVLDTVGSVREIAAFRCPPAEEPVRLLETTLPGTSIKIWLVDSPPHFDREGGPYLGPDGSDWPDNAERFTVFARAAEAVGMDRAGLSWRPDLVHCNDWQGGLAVALLTRHAERPATLFTIHNLAYQGLFPAGTFDRLVLPPELWSMHGLEYYGQLSFIKGGIAYADMLSTVSPQYAQEICTPEFGCGLENLLRHRSERLIGILNGADYKEWNPAKDPYIYQRYNAFSLHKKAVNKAALQQRFELAVDGATPLVGMIGRLAEQKGFDLMLAALPQLMRQPAQVLVLGSGSRLLEQQLRQAVAAYPGRVAAHFGYNEELAHQIEAGSDIFLMPSRYEPCGLNQIYSLRYGTVPVVHRTGGLANTVIDATEETLRRGSATGFIFDEPTPAALLAALDRALACYRQPRAWKRLAYVAMQQEFGWRQSAHQYVELYQRTAVLAAARGAG